MRWAGGSDWSAVATVFIAESAIFEADARILSNFILKVAVGILNVREWVSYLARFYGMTGGRVCTAGSSHCGRR